MSERRALNLFYEEPDEPRWLPYDQYPRRLLRRVIRGEPRIGGHQRVFLNLCMGLERVGVPFRVNDHRHAEKNPHELACIIGKPFVLDKHHWKNPILFGAAVYSHPIDDSNLLSRLPIKRILVPGEWMRRMCEPYWGGLVAAWPVGIDTDLWCPAPSGDKHFDVLLYDKIRWDCERIDTEFIDPIRSRLRRMGVTFREIRYGSYREKDFMEALFQCRSMIFLCEHETQGIAYQQALACGIPILAWDRGGFWQDPAYFPDKVNYAPVSSVPYWDERCGSRFFDLGEFDDAWLGFWDACKDGRYSPRDYILENLTLERCAREFCRNALEVSA